MNTKELVELLNSLPPDTVVSVNGYEGGIKDVVRAVPTRVFLGVNTERYYGHHSEYDEETRAMFEADGTPINIAPRVLIE